MNVSILVYMHIYIYMQYVYMCMCMYIHIHTYTQLHIHLHIHTYMETSHIHLHIHWHIHIRSYTYIYTYVTSHGSKRVSERCSIACVGKQLYIVFFIFVFSVLFDSHKGSMACHLNSNHFFVVCSKFENRMDEACTCDRAFVMSSLWLLEACTCDLALVMSSLWFIEACTCDIVSKPWSWMHFMSYGWKPYPLQWQS